MLPLYLCYRLLCLLVHWCRGKIGPPRAIPVRRLLTIEVGAAGRVGIQSDIPGVATGV